MKDEKNRHWTFLVYPESAPENWKEILQETGLPFAVSPLHDKDLNADGVERKKPHYHILVCFSGPTTFMKVNKLCASLNSPIPKRVLSIIGIYRYFTHKDNPEKYQYNEDDIQCFNGFDIKDYNQLTTSQTLAIKKELQKIILSNHILEYSDLMDYLLENDLNDFYQVASNNTMFFDRYISSKRNKIKDTLQDIQNMIY